MTAAKLAQQIYRDIKDRPDRDVVLTGVLRRLKQHKKVDAFLLVTAQGDNHVTSVNMMPEFAVPVLANLCGSLTENETVRDSVYTLLKAALTGALDRMVRAVESAARARKGGKEELMQ